MQKQSRCPLRRMSAKDIFEVMIVIVHVLEQLLICNIKIKQQDE